MSGSWLPLRLAFAVTVGHKDPRAPVGPLLSWRRAEGRCSSGTAGRCSVTTANGPAGRSTDDNESAPFDDAHAAPDGGLHPASSNYPRVLYGRREEVCRLLATAARRTLLALKSSSRRWLGTPSNPRKSVHHARRTATQRNPDEPGPMIFL